MTYRRRIRVLTAPTTAQAIAPPVLTREHEIDAVDIATMVEKALAQGVKPPITVTVPRGTRVEPDVTRLCTVEVKVVEAGQEPRSGAVMVLSRGDVGGKRDRTKRR